MTADAFSVEVAGLYGQESGHLVQRPRRHLSDIDAAEDVVQDAFLALSERRSLEGIRNPSAFLLGVVDNLAATYLREKYRRNELACRMVSSPVPNVSNDVSEAYERREASGRLDESVTRLIGRRDRKRLSLLAEGYRSREIADAETTPDRQITSKEVSWGLYNVRAKLRRELNPKDFLSGMFLVARSRRLKNGQIARAQKIGEALGRLDPSSVVLQVGIVFCLSIPNVAASAEPLKNLEVESVRARILSSSFVVANTPPLRSVPNEPIVSHQAETIATPPSVHSSPMGPAVLESGPPIEQFISSSQTLTPALSPAPTAPELPEFSEPDIGAPSRDDVDISSRDLIDGSPDGLLEPRSNLLNETSDHRLGPLQGQD